MEFYKKYSHMGYSYLAVPDPWKPIVMKAVIAIEKEMWPKWMPLFIKRWIHYLATGNSVVRIRSMFWSRVRDKLTGHMLITDIKDKYAGLRIYGYFNLACDKIVDEAEKACENTCEFCGSTDDVEIRDDYGWYRNLCDICSDKDKLQKLSECNLP